ncbi:MAG: tetratricopeptide repeat protein [Planctomycetota bacterium]
MTGAKLARAALPGILIILMLSAALSGCIESGKKIVTNEMVTNDDQGKKKLFDLKMKQYKELAREYPKVPKYRERIARLYWRGGDHKRALEQLRKARDLDPGNPRYDFLEGKIYFALGHASAAEACYKRMIENTPEEGRFTGPYFELAYLYLTEGRDREAEEVFQQCLEADPSFSAPHYYLGKIWERRRDEKKAIEHYEQYLTLGGREFHAEVMQHLRRLQPELEIYRP